MNLDYELNKVRKNLQMDEIISFLINNPQEVDNQLFAILTSENRRTEAYAWWIADKISRTNSDLLNNYYTTTAKSVINSGSDATTRCKLNTLLYNKRNITFDSLHNDLLNYCLNTIENPKEAPAIVAVCMKLSYKICSIHLELEEELYQFLSLMQLDYYSAAVHSTQKAILKQILKDKKRALKPSKK